jgi:zinc transporter, ZIP family
LPLWFWAGFWGLLAGSALLLGAAAGYFSRIPQQLTAGVTAFGSGVLISALSFELMDEAFRRGGFGSAALGFLAGAAVYTVADSISTAGGRSTASARAASSRPRTRSRGAASPSPSAPSSTASRNRSSSGSA